VNATDTFRSRFNRSPAGVWSAPGRVNLIGEHTDYNGGYVLPFAIDLRTQAAVSRRDDGRVSVLSVQRGGDPVEFAVEDLKPHANTGWAGYAVGVVWALRDKGFDVNGLDIVLDGRVPTGAGLSSSAAIECAVGLAALELSGIDLALEDMARIAQYAENEYVGVPCGLMDQMAVSVCRADRTPAARTPNAGNHARPQPNSWASRTCATSRAPSSTLRCAPSTTTYCVAGPGTSSPRTIAC
jgi:galactokinase